MSIRLHEDLAKSTAWQEIARQVDKLLAQEGLADYEVFLRPASLVEQFQMKDGVGGDSCFYPDEKRLEMVYHAWGAQPSIEDDPIEKVAEYFISLLKQVVAGDDRTIRIAGVPTRSHLEVITDTVADFQRETQVETVLIVVGSKSGFETFAAYHSGIKPDQIRKAWEAAGVADHIQIGLIGLMPDERSVAAYIRPFGRPEEEWDKWARDYLKYVANTVVDRIAARVYDKIGFKPS